MAGRTLPVQGSGCASPGGHRAGLCKPEVWQGIWRWCNHSPGFGALLGLSGSSLLLLQEQSVWIGIVTDLMESPELSPLSDVFGQRPSLLHCRGVAVQPPGLAQHQQDGASAPWEGCSPSQKRRSCTVFLGMIITFLQACAAQL